jgi:hypothetical protein
MADPPQSIGARDDGAVLARGSQAVRAANGGERADGAMSLIDRARNIGLDPCADADDVPECMLLRSTKHRCGRNRQTASESACGGASLAHRTHVSSLLRCARSAFSRIPSRRSSRHT